MPKGSEALTNARREEIIDACAQLYERLPFKEITLGAIGAKTSFTRTSIYNYFVAGELDKAQEAQDAVAALQRVFKFGNPNTIIKKAVNLLGYPVGDCRRPFNYLCQEGVEELKLVLKESAEKGMC